MDRSDTIGQKQKEHLAVFFRSWRRVRDSNPRFLLGTQHFESSCQKRTWRNLTEDNGRCENPENAVFSRLSASLRVENAVKIRVRESLPILPSSNGFSEKPIRIFDRTKRFFAPKSRFWQCVKRTGYAGLHPKSCRKMRGVGIKTAVIGKNICENRFQMIDFLPIIWYTNSRNFGG